MAVENANWLHAFGLLQLDVAPDLRTFASSGIERVERTGIGSYRVVLTEKLTYAPPDGPFTGAARVNEVDNTTDRECLAIIYTPQAAFPGDVHVQVANAAGNPVDGVTVFLTVHRFPTQD